MWSFRHHGRVSEFRNFQNLDLPESFRFVAVFWFVSLFCLFFFFNTATISLAQEHECE